MNAHSQDPLRTDAYIPNEDDTVDSSPTTGPDPKAPSADLPNIPGYAILGEIARGGMGVVFAANDLALDREVAIKMVLGGDHEGTTRRFVRESKITAKLPHPGIPPVHGLGTLENGSPFLAMKLIRGQTLAKLLKSNDRTPANLLQIFEQIAQAVGFAHAKGIIHRDLKPANVMVGEFGEVQVMDWGLAKQTHEDDRVAATRSGAPEAPADATRDGTIMGTPAYMAPEQARGEAVDARADVFALGGILCEILTGKPTFAKSKSAIETIQAAASGKVDDAFARLRDCGADAEVVEIATRCLNPDAEARYPDGMNVAQAVAAYHSGVVERLRLAEGERAAAEIRAGEQHKKRRIVQIAAGAVAAVLLAGTVVSLWQMLRAQDAETATAKQSDETQRAEAKTAEQLKLTQEAEAATVAQLKLTETARADAVEKLGFSRKSNVILGSVFTGLDPQANYATVAELRNALKANLRKAVQELDGSAIGDPLAVAAMQDTLGRSLLGLGEATLAIEVLEKARAMRRTHLGPYHPDTLTSMNNLASGYEAAGKFDHALLLFEETLKLSKAQLGPDHPDTLTSMNNLAESYRAAGKLDQALPLFKETLKLRKARLGPGHPATLTSMGNLAGGYRAAGKLDHALPLLEEALKLRKAQLGPDHPDTLTSMSNLAMGYRAAGKLDHALPLLEEALKLRKAQLGPGHPDTLTSMNSLAMSYQTAGKLDQALPLYEETRKQFKAQLGPDHPDTLTSMNNLAAGYQAAGKLDQALPLYEEALKLQKARLGPDHPDTLTTVNNLAMGYEAAGKLDQALPLYEEALKLRKALLGPDHPDTHASMYNLATGYQAAGKLDKALSLLEETLYLMKAKLGPDHPTALGILGQLGKTYIEAKQGEKAATTLSAFVAGMRKKVPKGHPQFAGLLAQVSLELLKCDQFAVGEEMLREALSIREKAEPDAWTTFNTQSMLGATLLGQKKHAEAEPLLLAGYEGMKKVEKTIPPAANTRIPEALDRLIAFSMATNKPADVAKWRAERAKYPPETAPKPRVGK